MLLSLETSTNSILQFLTVLIIFVFVLGLTWFTTRYIASFQKGKMKGSNIEILDSFRLSQNKLIEIIRIGNKVLAISVCKDSVTVLTELELESIQTKEEFHQGEQLNFSDFMDKAKRLIHKSEQEEKNQNEINK